MQCKAQAGATLCLILHSSNLQENGKPARECIMITVSHVAAHRVTGTDVLQHRGKAACTNSSMSPCCSGLCCAGYEWVTTVAPLQHSQCIPGGASCALCKLQTKWSASQAPVPCLCKGLSAQLSTQRQSRRPGRQPSPEYAIAKDKGGLS